MLVLADAYDAKDILDRLRNDEERSIQETGGSFHGNRGIILKAFKDNELWAIKDEEKRGPKDARTLGFLVGKPRHGELDILEVWREFRRKGIGREAVAEFVELALRARSIGVRVTCHPESSEAFWRAQGFTSPLIRLNTNEIELYRACRVARPVPKGRKWTRTELRFEVNLLGRRGPRELTMPEVLARREDASVIFRTPVALPNCGLERVAVFCDGMPWLDFVYLEDAKTVRHTPHWIEFKSLQQTAP